MIVTLNEFLEGNFKQWTSGDEKTTVRLVYGQMHGEPYYMVGNLSNWKYAKRMTAREVLNLFPTGDVQGFLDYTDDHPNWGGPRANQTGRPRKRYTPEEAREKLLDLLSRADMTLDDVEKLLQEPEFAAAYQKLADDDWLDLPPGQRHQR